MKNAPSQSNSPSTTQVGSVPDRQQADTSSSDIDNKKRQTSPSRDQGHSPSGSSSAAASSKGSASDKAHKADGESP